MQRKQTAEQAAARAREILGEAFTVRVTDYGKRVTFAAPDFSPRDAVEEQFTDAQRFDALLKDLKSKILQSKK